ncbi:hypothetical protein SynA1560_01204 [Synechococcus sp. A15-60]|nr:hypothetical protein SynA1560_01204 [Synechococcus sp. A15-60]
MQEVGHLERRQAHIVRRHHPVDLRRLASIWSDPVSGD